uniref:MPN domain-containing protein n=1 Tax=Rhabditophanes sp. KR3021 TaxID=114890 RepID=A0AC35U0P2_9BILA
MDTKIKYVQLDCLVLMKIVKHVDSELESGLGEISGDNCQGILTGLISVEDGKLEVTNCFPTPRFENYTEGEESNPQVMQQNDDLKQGEMLDTLRKFRNMNMDYELVGFYESQPFGACFTQEMIESLANVQAQVQDGVALVYDPLLTRQGKMGLRALRLSQTALDLFNSGDWSPETIRSTGLTYQTIFEELPIVVKNSHLANVMFAQLNIEKEDAFCDSLHDLSLENTGNLEKSLRGMNAGVDELNKQLSSYNKYIFEKSRAEGQLAALLTKRVTENESRVNKGEQPLPLEEIKRTFRIPTWGAKNGLLDIFLTASGTKAHADFTSITIKENLHKILAIQALQQAGSTSDLPQRGMNFAQQPPGMNFPQPPGGMNIPQQQPGANFGQPQQSGTNFGQPGINFGQPQQSAMNMPQPPGINTPQQQSMTFGQSQQPGINLPQQPNMGFGQPQQPGTNMPQQPGMNMPQQSGLNTPQQPSMNLPPQPGMNMPQQPGMNFPQQPGMNLPPQPGMNFPQQPGMNLPQQPGMNMLQQPGMNTPQQPGMNTPQQPGMNMPPQPGMNMPPQQPGMNMPQQPGMNFPQQPGMNFPQQPGMNFPQQPGMNQPMGMPPGMGPQPPKAKLDLSEMPSVVQVREDDSQSKGGKFETGYPNAELPPLTTTKFVAVDQGNSSPRFMRSTMYAVPTTNDLIKTSHLPFAVSIAPFAETEKDEYAPPVVDLGVNGPVRCDRCKAYMCPSMQFIDGGRKFKCAFCNGQTTVEESYFAHLDHTGRRTDISHRAELCLGTYDMLATKSYCKNSLPPKEPAFIFMLDVSYNAIKTGLVATFCKNFKDVLLALPKDDPTQVVSPAKVGLVTYDKTLHFYNFDSKTQKVEMSIVTDIDDVFAPFIDGFLVSVDVALSNVDRITLELQKQFSETRITDTVLGPVIQGGLDALKSADRAGKLVIFHTSLPTVEAPGKLANRDDRKALGTDGEKKILTPAIDFYGKLGSDCVKAGVSVDLFLFPNAFVDVATLSPLVSLSSGNLFKYQYFDSEKDGNSFVLDLKKAVRNTVAFDAIMRVRTSAGIRPTGFLGHFLMQNSTDMEFGCLDRNKEVFVEIKYDDKLVENEPCYVQSATLFTSVSGSRRLRIHNLALNTTADFNLIYRFIESDTFMAYWYKAGEKVYREKSLKDMKNHITGEFVHNLGVYRDKCSINSPIGQLVLPETLRLLPMYYTSILKNDGLAGGSDMSVDDRAWMLQLIAGLKTEEIVRLLYPRVLPVTELVMEGPDSELILPGEVRAYYDNLKSNQAYLIASGMIMFIWIGHEVDPKWLHDVFRANNIQSLDTEAGNIPVLDNPHSLAVRTAISQVSKDAIRHGKTYIIRQADGLEAWMKKFLVEDRHSGQVGSYVDGLVTLHREIRSIMS